jgi:DNA-binding Lrp family transcriptional regulator
MLNQNTNSSQSIIRIVHDRNNPYTIINNRSLNDQNLTFEAAGFWARLLSKPASWTIRTANLAKEYGVSVDTIRRLMNVLLRAGYVHRVKVLTPHRAIVAWEYYVFETKTSSEEFQKMFPECKNPSLDRPVPGQTPTINNTYLEKVLRESNNSLVDTPEECLPPPPRNGGRPSSENVSRMQKREGGK